MQRRSVRVLTVLRFLAIAFLISFPVLSQTPAPISTVAGTGIYGYGGDSGPATAAQLDVVCALASDAKGNIYIADSWNHRVRKIASNGVITTVAGTGQPGYAGDGGAATSAQLAYPRGLAVDAQGNLYIADSANSRIRKVAADGKISTVAGSGVAGYSGDGADAASAQLNYPRGLAVDGAGSLYIADSWNYRVRRVSLQGQISTAAGNGTYGSTGDAGQATAATLGFVQSLALDRQGNLYVSDVYNHSVRKIAANGVISTVIGGGFGSAGDGGSAQSAQLKFPRGLGADSQGNLFVVDAGNHRVRMVSPSGTITTVAGTGTAGFSGDGGAASAAQLNNPYDVVLDASGALVVADVRNYRVRKAGVQAGGGGGGAGDNKPSVSGTAGVQNAATFAPPAAPGMLATIWGVKMASGIVPAGSVPLPTSLGGATVMVDSTPMPLLYVSPTQINGQLPSNLAAGAHSLKVVVTGGVESDPITFDVQAASPGVFLWDNNRGVVVNQDYSLNSAANPIDRGKVVTIYATGSGQVQPPVADGAAASASPLSRTPDQPVVIIGGRQAEVQYSGLAPGWVGLWQINAVVPQDAPTGSAVTLQVIMGGAASNVATLAVK